ncbi:Transcriptional regulator of ribosomal biogenesis protein [Polyrhizophydium stewartii]|uniref:Transcriptional regulator of ribosomal biogenesis protein n=1 Tax=Polyrhizophydium stewartii TaxID=2732419 RepID=A0ABR4NEX1_9FUNG
MTPHPPSSAYSHLSAYGRGHASMSLPSSLPSSPSRTPPAPAHLQTASYPLPPPSTASIATSTTSQPTSSGLEPGLLAKSTPGSAALAPATTALAQPSLAPASAHPARQPAPASVAGSSTSGVSLAALQTPDPNRPFTCPYVDCYKSYKNSNGLKYHLIHVHREYPASSGIASGSSLGGSSAGESGSTTAVLNTSPHPSAIYIHPSERYYHCPVQTPVCGKTYRSAGGLKYHMRTFHRNLSDGERRQYVAYARSRAEWRMPTEAEAAGTVPLVQPPRLAAHTDAPQLMLPLQLHTLSISTSSVLSSGAATPAAVVSMEMPHSPLTMRAAWPDLGMHSAPSSASATTFTAHSQDQHQHQQHFDQAMPHLHLHPVSPLPDGLHTPLVAPPADPSQPVPMQWQFPAPPDHPGPRHYGER